MHADHMEIVEESEWRKEWFPQEYCGFIKHYEGWMTNFQNESFAFYMNKKTLLVEKYKVHKGRGLELVDTYKGQEMEKTKKVFLDWIKSDSIRSLI